MAENVPSVVMVVEQLRRRVPGGIGVYAHGLLGGLAACPDPQAPLELTLLASRGPRHGDPLAEFGRPLLVSRLPGPLLSRAWDRRLVRAPRGFGVVHSVSLAAPLPRRSSTSRLVVSMHDLAWRRRPEATTARGRRWHEGALHRARDHAAAFVVPSRLVARDLTAAGVDPARVVIVAPGADHLPAPDPAGTDAVLARLGLSGEFLLAVGTLEPRKNIERLVLAYGRVRPSLPGPWPLLIVGPTGWGREPPRAVASSGVVLAGAVPAAVLTELYRRARAFAYVPLTEGYGLPPLEAMRAGTPSVVAREVPSVHDLGDPAAAAARLVDAFDVEDIASGLGDVLTDDAVRADLSTRGPAYARNRTWGAAAQQHLELWSGLQ